MHISRAAIIFLFSVLILHAMVIPTHSMEKDVASISCDTIVGSTTLDELRKQQSVLEEALAASRVPNDSQQSSTSPNSTEKERETQNRLIDVLYQAECFRSDFEKNDQILRGSPATLSIPLFYATNRRSTDTKQIDDFYGYEDTRELSYGITTISIPSLHKPGELELPSLWKLEWRSNPDRHFQVSSVTPLGTPEAKSRIVSELAKAKSKSLLLFVHGYNVSFVDASYRTAQLAYDLRFPGLVMFYSWPSMGKTSGYLHDEESAHLAVPIFDQLFDDVSSMNFDEIYIVAHSMGNRVVGEALAQRLKGGKDVRKVRELLLAAPDINAEIFKSEIAPFLAGLSSARKTIYASSQDLALRASNIVHGFPRVGDTNGGVRLYSTFDTIDASGAAPLLRSFGHSYVLDSTVVLNDLEDVILWHRSLSERTLRQLGIAPNLYWAIR